TCHTTMRVPLAGRLDGVETEKVVRKSFGGNGITLKDTLLPAQPQYRVNPVITYVLVIVQISLFLPIKRPLTFEVCPAQRLRDIDKVCRTVFLDIGIMFIEAELRTQVQPRQDMEC